jgi:hypothetical protein
LLEHPTAAQERRRDALRAAHHASWLGTARPYVSTWADDDITPSFPARVQCSMPKLAEGSPQIRALGPRTIVSIVVSGRRREVAAIAKLPLGTLHGVALVGDHYAITDESLATLAPALRGVHTLELHAGRFASPRGWIAVLDQIEGVERLALAIYNDLERWLELLLASSSAKTLRSLLIPKRISLPLRSRLERELSACAIELRDEGRLRHDRALGYYVLD